MQPPPAPSFQRESPPDFRPRYDSLPSQHWGIRGLSSSARLRSHLEHAEQQLMVYQQPQPLLPDLVLLPRRAAASVRRCLHAPSATTDHAVGKAGICWGTHHRRGWCCSLLSHSDIRLAVSQHSLWSIASIALGVTSSHLPKAPSEQTFC